MIEVGCILKLDALHDNPLAPFDEQAYFFSNILKFLKILHTSPVIVP